MTSLVIGGNGVLGSAIVRLENAQFSTRRHGPGVYYCLDLDPAVLPTCDVSYLCAGTKGYKECEGNAEAFRPDVDGNIKLIRHLFKAGSFIVFISSEGVEWGAATAYARNRLLVESALWMMPRTAIVRPGKFDAENVEDLARRCIEIGNTRVEGIHYWRPH